MPPMIEVDDLTKSYGSSQVLGPVTFDVPAGERTVLLGPNGAGKSTLLEILTTLRRPTTGHARLCGHDVVHDTAAARRSVGVVLQQPTLDASMSARALLRFQARAAGLVPTARERRTGDLLDLFRLAERSDEPVSRFSGGMRRRIDLALALVAGPPVLILDEPTTGVDPGSRLELWDELRRLNTDDGVTLLCSTQDLHEAEELATDVVVLRDGRVIAHDRPAELKTLVGSRTVVASYASAPDAARAASALGRPAPSDDTLWLRVPTDESIARSLGQVLAVPGATVREVELREPSLDDVFRSLVAEPEGVLR